MRKYLSDKGHRRSVLNSLSMYTIDFVPGICLNKDTIQEINEREIMKVCRPGIYMGMWKVATLSSVLQMPQFSVYPQLGNPVLREVLHRLVLPRDPSLTCPMAF